MSKRKKAAVIIGCLGLAILFLAASFYIGMTVWEHNQRNKVTYVNGEEKHSYKSLARLVEKEKLEFLFPTEIPEEVRVTEVREFGKDGSYHFSFSPIGSGYTMVAKREAEPRQPEESAEKIVCSGVSFEIKMIQEKERPNPIYWAGGWYNGYWYIFQAPSREDLLMMLNSLE